MNKISEEHFDRMRMMVRTFKSNSIKHPTFLPEFKASKSINEIIESTTKPTEETFSEILKILSEIDLTEHYNGSQWHDYKIHLNAILRENGFEKSIL